MFERFVAPPIILSGQFSFLVDLEVDIPVLFPVVGVLFDGLVDVFDRLLDVLLLGHPSGEGEEGYQQEGGYFRGSLHNIWTELKNKAISSVDRPPFFHDPFLKILFSVLFRAQ